jgi:hypothetical protein
VNVYVVKYSECLAYFSFRVTVMDERDQERVISGCHIEVELIYRSGEVENLAFDLVEEQYADYQAGFLSISTPLGNAILGEKAGTLVPYFSEDIQGVRILTISKMTRATNKEATSRRETSLKETLDQIQYRDAVLFASSVNTKWGGYDADSLSFDTWISPKNKTKEDTEANPQNN